MSKLKLWRNNKTKDYKFIDRSIFEYFEISGTQMFIHKYVGTYDEQGNVLENIKIQDLLFMETRDRKYDPNVIEIFGIYTVSDNDFELSQFGFFQSDTLYIDFHMNSMADQLGRRLSTGDVLELTHLRDDMLDYEEGAINAFYVVEEGRRGADGYGPTWLPHIWRVRVKKISDSREYSDILENQNGDLTSLLSDYNKLISINENTSTEANTEVPYQHPYDPAVYNSALDGALPVDPNLDLTTVEKSITFPLGAPDGTYIIRTDYQPNQLFKKVNGKWELVDQEILKDWIRLHQHTDEFVNNENTTINEDGTTRPERTYISNPTKPIIDDDLDETNE